MTAHTVKAGDTLGKIARRFGVPLEALVILNQIADPDRIRAGQTVQIPELCTDELSATPVPVEEPVAVPPAPVLDVNTTRYRLAPTHYFPEVTAKDLIVLHFTAGRTAKSAYDTWLASPARVATPFIVDANGTIFQTFDPSHWAYHLGVKGATRLEKRSIGIEIANVGPLKRSPANPQALNWWPNDWTGAWCRMEETSRYVRASYRGIDYFASFTDEQVQAVAGLVCHLCDRFGIPRTIPPAARRMEFDSAYFASYRGVAGHHNFRADKWDMGPALDWARLGF